MQKIVKYVLDNRLAIFLMTFILLAGGLYSTFTMKRETMPDMTIPYLVVTTAYPGATPEDIADKVAKPSEQVIKNLENVKKVDSTSNQNFAMFQIEYEYGVDMTKQKATLENALKDLELGDGVQAPQVLEISMDSMPVVSFTVSDKNLSRSELSKVVENELVPQLEDTEGVSSVGVSGLATRQLQLTYKEQALKQYEVTKDEVNAWFTDTNKDVSLGLFTFEKTEQAVAIMQETKNIDKLLKTKVPKQNKLGRALRLNDFVTIKEIKTDDTISRVNGEEALTLSVQKGSKYNTLDVANAVKDTLADYEKNHKSTNIVTLLDMGEPIDESVNTMLTKALFGALMAVIIILLFLRNVRSTIISIISIPLSLLIAIGVMHLLDYTLNIMTLGAMTIAIGRVIDDSIVVVENIYRRIHMDRNGLKPKQLVASATVEMFMPILSSTAVTAVVFLPLALVGGMIGQITLPFALAMIFSLLASLVVAITLVPALAYLLFKKELRTPENELNAHEQKEQKLALLYKKSLNTVLGHKVISIIVTVLIFGGSLALIPKVGFSFMPADDVTSITAVYTPEIGETREQKVSALKDAEKLLQDFKDVKTVQVTFGSTDEFAVLRGSDAPQAMVLFNEDVKGEVIQDAAESLETKLNKSDAKGEWKATASASSAGSMSSTSGSLSYSVLGNDRENAAQVTKEIEQILKDQKDVTDVTSSLSTRYVENQLVLDKDKLSAFGLSGKQLGYMLMNIGSDNVVTQLNYKGEETDLIVKYEAKSYDAMKDMMDAEVLPMVKLKDLTKLEQGKTYSKVTRQDGTEVTTVSATYTGNSLSKVSSAIQEKIDKLAIPTGIEVSTGGDISQMKSAFLQLGLAMLAAIIIVYLVLVMTFKEGLAPFAILFSLPLSIIGVVLGLLIAKEPLGVSAMLGVLMLIGIVVTNAIVLIDRVINNEKNGMTIRDSLLEAGATRLRPILMTAIATVGSLLPVALGAESGGLIGTGLGVTVIGGLISSTFLTLFVVPLAYEFLSKLFRKDRSKIEE